MLAASRGWDTRIPAPFCCESHAGRTRDPTVKSIEDLQQRSPQILDVIFYCFHGAADRGADLSQLRLHVRDPLKELPRGLQIGLHPFGVDFHRFGVGLEESRPSSHPVSQLKRVLVELLLVKQAKEVAATE